MAFSFVSLSSCWRTSSFLATFSISLRIWRWNSLSFNRSRMFICIEQSMFSMESLCILHKDWSWEISSWVRLYCCCLMSSSCFFCSSSFSFCCCSSICCSCFCCCCYCNCKSFYSFLGIFLGFSGFSSGSCMTSSPLSIFSCLIVSSSLSLSRVSCLSLCLSRRSFSSFCFSSISC